LDKTALAWQYCSWFRQGAAVVQFGSVDGAKKFDQINTFPVLTSKIEAYIAAADYSLVNTDYDTRGLCAIEYLIHTFDEKDSVIVANFVSSENRKAYLKALVLAIKTRANTVKNAWATDRANYISAVGMDGESSCSHTALDMDVDFDNIKNNKVGIPVGRVVAGLELLAFPDKTEAFYSGYSLKYLRANIKAIENVWLGRSLVGTDGLGFDDYLNSVNAANITLATKSKFNAIYAKLDAIPEGRLSEIIKTNKEPVRELYAELQGLTQYLKTDMVSALGLSITYASGDGD
jgi:predicted lipoprotein